MRYHAFISYSHGADARLAPALQRALQRFAKPWWKARAVNVFRDETSLALAHSLPETLTQALNASAHFILMASPLAGQSKWVAGECEYWAKHKDPQRMLVVLTAGEIAWDSAACDFDWTKTTALPPVLKGVFKQEPLYLDLRWANQAEHFSDRHPDFLKAVAKISAALRGMSLDRIAGEEVRQHRTTKRIAYAAVSAIALLAAGASAGAWIATERSREAERQRAAAEEQRKLAEDRRVEAERQRREAETQRAEAVRQRDRAGRSLANAIAAAETLVVQVGDGMRDFVGVPVARRRAVLAGAEAIFDRIARESDHPRVALGRATMLATFADAYIALGDLAKAVEKATAAAEVLRGMPPPAAADRALHAYIEWLAPFRLGTARLAQGDPAAALAAFRSALALAKRHADASPPSAAWLGHYAHSLESVGDALIIRGDLAGAVEAHTRSFAVRERLAKLDPGNSPRQQHLAVSRIKLGELAVAQRRRPEGLAHFRAALALMERLHKAEPEHVQWAADVAAIRVRIGDVLRDASDPGGALKSYEGAQAVYARLAALDPRNTRWQRELAVAHNRRGEAYEMQREDARALEAYRASLAIGERLAALDPSNTVWRRDLSVSHEKIGDAMYRQRRWAEALRAYAASLAIRETLVAADASVIEWQRDLSVSHERIGDVRRADGDLAGALESHRASLAIRRKLSARDPNNVSRLVDLARSHARIAAVMEAQNDRPGLLAATAVLTEVIARAAALEPANALWLAELARVRRRLGDLHRAGGDFAAALAAYRAGLAPLDKIVELAPAGPRRRQWQREVAAARIKIGVTLAAQGERAAARRELEEALRLFETLAENQPDDARLRDDLEAVRKRVDELGR